MSRNHRLSRRTVADELRDKLIEFAHDAGLRKGDELPPVTQLAQHLDATRTGIREALDLLADEGVVEQNTSRRWLLLSRPRRPNAREGNGHASLADQAVEAIRSMILTKNLKTGDPLPPASELADQLGVSTVVIREALASLSAREILDRRQGREPVVAMPSHEIIGSILEVRAHLDDIDVLDFYQARRGLELQAVTLATELPDAEYKASALQPTLDAMAAARTMSQLVQADHDFHIALADLSGNRALALLIRALHGLVRTSVRTTIQRVAVEEGDEGVAAAARRHDRVAEAIIDGDLDRALHWMEVHFTEGAPQ